MTVNGNPLGSNQDWADLAKRWAQQQQRPLSRPLVQPAGLFAYPYYNYRRPPPLCPSHRFPRYEIPYPLVQPPLNRVQQCVPQNSPLRPSIPGLMEKIIAPSELPQKVSTKRRLPAWIREGLDTMSEKAEIRDEASSKRDPETSLNSKIDDRESTLLLAEKSSSSEEECDRIPISSPFVKQIVCKLVTDLFMISTNSIIAKTVNECCQEELLRKRLRDLDDDEFDQRIKGTKRPKRGDETQFKR
ncbi:hypothetical protein ACOME3_008118 [Neoechinorhynchus agilis]